jgi:hypothetical protein
VVILDIANRVIPQLLRIEARTMRHFDNPLGEAVRREAEEDWGDDQLDSARVFEKLE